MPPSPSFWLFTIVWRQTFSQLCSLTSHFSFVFFSYYCVPVCLHWSVQQPPSFVPPIRLRNSPYRIGRLAIINCSLVEPLSFFYLSVMLRATVLLSSCSSTHRHRRTLCMFDMVICIERNPFNSTTYLSFSKRQRVLSSITPSLQKKKHRTLTMRQWCRLVYLCAVQCGNPNTAEVKERSYCHLSTLLSSLPVPFLSSFIFP